jgi:hypothetical protein
MLLRLLHSIAELLTSLLQGQGLEMKSPLDGIVDGLSGRALTASSCTLLGNAKGTSTGVKHLVYVSTCLIQCAHFSHQC